MNSFARIGLLLIATLAAASAPADDDSENPDPAEAAPIEITEPWEILGTQIPAGTKTDLQLVPSETFGGMALETPVFVLRGGLPGPTVCLTAGVHGDELTGIEIVRRIVNETDPKTLHGVVIGVPIVNIHGFRRSSRYLPDRRDLNRYFPGNPQGSSASRIAHAIFYQVIRHCEHLVDFHSGSFHRTNIAQIRGDLEQPGVLWLAHALGEELLISHPGGLGTLRRSATGIGIPAITYEVGEPMRFYDDEITRGVGAMTRLLRALSGREPDVHAETPRPTPDVFWDTRWVRAENGGFLYGRVALGTTVRKGQLLGVVINPISNERAEIHSPEAGRLIGMALNQVVIPGFAAFHLGIAHRPDATRESGEDREMTRAIDPAAEGMEPEERPE